jgi:hypothetical protein
MTSLSCRRHVGSKRIGAANFISADTVGRLSSERDQQVRNGSPLPRVKSYTTSRDTTADGLFSAKRIAPLSPQISEIDQLMPIVAETEQIPNRRNSPLNSRAQISDGPRRRFFIASGKVYPARSICWYRPERSSGSEGANGGNSVGSVAIFAMPQLSF